MNGITLFTVQGALLINRITGNIHNPAEGLIPDWYCNLVTRINGGYSPLKPFSRIHCNTPDGVVANMLSHFQNEIVFTIIYGRVCHGEC